MVVHMLTNVAGYLEVYQQELQQRLAITRPEDTIAADAAFSSTRTLCPAPQLAACLTHHADLMRQLSGVMPLQSVASDLAAVAAAAPSVPVVHAAKAGISAMSKCGPAPLLCSSVCACHRCPEVLGNSGGAWVLSRKGVLVGNANTLSCTIAWKAYAWFTLTTVRSRIPSGNQLQHEHIATTHRLQTCACLLVCYKLYDEWHSLYPQGNDPLQSQELWRM